jgi:hypothetical protein
MLPPRLFDTYSKGRKCAESGWRLKWTGEVTVGRSGEELLQDDTRRKGKHGAVIA